MKMLRKLTPKTIMAPVGVKKPEKPCDLFLIYGRATTTKKAPASQYGDAWALVGNFEAKRLSDGEMFRAPVAYLPNPFHDAAVANLHGGAEMVEFALRIGIEPNDKAGVGYAYTTEPLMDVKADEGINQLRALAGVTVAEAAQPALAAPAATPAPAASSVPSHKSSEKSNDKGGKKK